MRAWHFLSDNSKTRYTNEGVVPEKWLEAKGEIELCRNGMHASKRILDALSYAPGSMICRVEVEGEIISDSDKLVARRRKVIWMFDGTMLLHEFACRCAEDISLGPPSLMLPVVTDTVTAKRAWMRGEITDGELKEKLKTHLSTPYFTALSSARHSARGAAYCVAYREADYVACGVAYSTARKKQNKRLTSMVMSEARKLNLC